MGASFTPELKKILTEAGCYFERQGKEDHEIWYSPMLDEFQNRDKSLERKPKVLASYKVTNKS
ncbi:type II toxin-antitoxin system HicA family toxin [Dendronalium phyllosphericum]|uniref:type II toxin-antitoxin system HicA family toxin n=1 Tax=Dendronalium phyllosphericum TaxID=2840445 RepID=UPI001CEDC009|nr:type II toxin-antitoxin system HicA family toxin [Dendronalium phyllosphericum]